MALDTLVNQTLAQATATLTLAHSIRRTLQDPERLWRH